MPYILVPYKRGWRVKSETSGRYFSKKPLSKKTAIKQQRLLYAIERDGSFKEGKGYCEICTADYKHKQDDAADELEGGGLFNNIVASARQFFSRTAKSIFTKTAEATTRAVRMDYPPKVRKYLADNGAGVVQSITIQRTPINSAIDKALNFLTAGKFEEAKRKYAYDKLFHLSMVCIYTINGRIERVFIEKNEVINMTESYSIQKDTEIMPVPMDPGKLSLATMMTNAANKAGPAFFQYDAFTNNCQMFINTILDANGLNTPAVAQFVNQDAASIVKELPEFVGPLARTVTNVAAIADKAIAGAGEGKVVGDTIVMKKSDFMKEHRRLLKLLKRHPDLKAEYKDQLAEMKRYQGGGGSDSESSSESESDTESELSAEDISEEQRELVRQQRAAARAVSEALAALIAGDATIDEAKEAILDQEFQDDIEEQALASLEALWRRWALSDPEGEQEVEDEEAETEEDEAEGSGKATHRENVLKMYGLPDKPHSIAQLAKASGVPRDILQQVYNRGVGAYKTQPKSVRLRGSFVKNVDAPMSKKLSKEQWGYARVYSFLDGNPAHDNDLRANKGSGYAPFLQQLSSLGIKPAEYLASVRRSAASYGIDPDAVHLADDDSKIVVRGPDGKLHRAGRTGYGDYHIYQLLEKKGAAPLGSAEQHRKSYLARATKIKGNWKKNKYSPNSLAVYVLWH